MMYPPTHIMCRCSLMTTTEFQTLIITLAIQARFDRCCHDRKARRRRPLTAAFGFIPRRINSKAY